DSVEAWGQVLRGIQESEWIHSAKVDAALRQEIATLACAVNGTLDRGGEQVNLARRKIHRHRAWFSDDRLRKICNHCTRSHIRNDLQRYFFVSSFGKVHGKSPLLNDFPTELLPKH